MKKTLTVLLVLLVAALVMVTALGESAAMPDLEHDLFLVPVSSDDWGSASGEQDTALHFFPIAGEMYLNGAHLWGSENMPEGFAPYDGEEGATLHIQAIKNRAGDQYIPLFTSFDVLFSLLGTDIHVGVVSYEEAAQMARTKIIDVINGEQVIVECSGIVVAPGILNTIIPLDQLPASE